jgi:hypothetical protein
LALAGAFFPAAFFELATEVAAGLRALVVLGADFFRDAGTDFFFAIGMCSASSVRIW